MGTTARLRHFAKRAYFEVVPLAQPLCRPLLRLAYDRALRTEDSVTRRSRLSRALRWRRYVYPQGGVATKLARFDDHTRLWVNVCELEGGNLYFGVEFEPCELTVVAALINKGEVFFDVGANVGGYTLTASRIVGDTGAVHAFEPSSRTYRLLLRNIQMNGAKNVTLNHVAVQERGGEVDLFVNRESGLTSLGKTDRGQVLGTERVSSVSLDEYARKHSLTDLDLLKVDVEGFEGHVLRGGKELIERASNLGIMCELADKNVRPLGLSITTVLDWVRDRGYEVWEIDRPRRALVPLGDQRDSYQNQNFLFVRPGTQRQRATQELSRRGLGR